METYSQNIEEVRKYFTPSNDLRLIAASLKEEGKENGLEYQTQN